MNVFAKLTVSFGVKVIAVALARFFHDMGIGMFNAIYIVAVSSGVLICAVILPALTRKRMPDHALRLSERLR